MEDNKMPEIAQVGDKVEVTYLGMDEGFKVGSNGPVSFQMLNASANSLNITAINGLLSNLETIEDENEKEMMIAITYDELNNSFTNILEMVMPKALEESFAEEAERELANEDIYLDLKFKAQEYEKLVEAMGKHDKGYVKVSKDDVGRLTYK